MAHLFNVIDFPALSRMTGIWTNSTHDADVGDEVAFAQLIVFPPDQDPVVESDFLCGHLPFHVGGFHGVFPDGQGWAVVLQKASAATSMELMGASESHWVLIDAIDRALRFNYGAEAQDWFASTRSLLLTVYHSAGADLDIVEDWSVTELLWGLLAECCNVPLIDIVDGYAQECAFPGREHDCQGDVFRDVFALWTTRALSAPEPDLDEIFDGEPAPEFIRWTRKELKKLKKRDLLRIAIDDGWDRVEVESMSKKSLIALMQDEQGEFPS